MSNPPRKCVSRFDVYVITNTSNGRRYVGVTTRGIRRRWCEHVRASRDGIKTALYAAFRKYGTEVFRVDHVASALSLDSLKVLERVLIAQLDTRPPKGYNLTLGGDGVEGLPREIVERTAESNRGRKHSKKAKQLIGVASKGHVVTPEMRAAIGAARRGKPLTQAHRAKLSKSKIGKKLPERSPEHSARISAGLVAAHARRKERESGSLL